MGRLIDDDDAIDAVSEALERVFVEHRDIAEKTIKKVPSAQPEYYDYSDIEPLWKSFAEENDINLNSQAKQLKDAMWCGYEKGKRDAQSESIRINLNEWIKVKLTDLGKEIYYHQYDELNKAYGREMLKPNFPSEDEDGYTRFQLWKFIQLYGSHIGIGTPNVIDPIDIVFEEENQCANWLMNKR